MEKGLFWQPTHRKDIDGMRAIAVLAVVFYHAFPTLMPGGFIGVDVFFVLSGYLISSIIINNLNRGTFSFAEFYARRIRRIFPALILVLLAMLLAGWFFLLEDEFISLGKHIVAGSSFFSNFVLWRESGYFDASADTKPLLHLWSLAIEEQFYIFWPVFLWGIWKKREYFLLGIISIAAFSLLGNLFLIKKMSVAVFYIPFFGPVNFFV